MHSILAVECQLLQLGTLFIDLGEQVVHAPSSLTSLSEVPDDLAICHHPGWWHFLARDTELSSMGRVFFMAR